MWQNDMTVIFTINFAVPNVQYIGEKSWKWNIIILQHLSAQKETQKHLQNDLSVFDADTAAFHPADSDAMDYQHLQQS